MDEITEIRQLMDPPPGLRPATVQAARHQLALAAAGPPRPPRRGLPALTAVAGAAAAAAAVAVAATGPGHGPQTATLAAWTVSRATDATVTVTLREFRDPQGLQDRLTAAGVPALVQYSPGGCRYAYQPIAGNAGLIGQVVARDARQPGSLAVFTIHPGAIPAGTRLDIVFPSLSGKTAKPAPASSQQAGPGASPSPPAGNQAPAAHPVTIRLIPAGQPQCPGPSPRPSAS
jgi:hypothetical protein